MLFLSKVSALHLFIFCVFIKSLDKPMVSGRNNPDGFCNHHLGIWIEQEDVPFKMSHKQNYSCLIIHCLPTHIVCRSPLWQHEPNCVDVVCPGRTLVQGKFGRCGMYRPIVETKVEETWTVRISDCRDMGFTDRSYKSILCRGILFTVDGGPEGTGL